MNIDHRALGAFVAVLALAVTGCVILDSDESDAAEMVYYPEDIYGAYDKLNFQLFYPIVFNDSYTDDVFVTLSSGSEVSIDVPYTGSNDPITDGVLVFYPSIDEVGFTYSIASNSMSYNYVGVPVCDFTFTYNERDFNIHIQEDIDFTSPDAVEGVSGGAISYTAATNIPATYSEAGGNAVDWLDVDASTGKVSGNIPSVEIKTTFTYQIKATSIGDSSNSTTQTITIDVWPIAQIIASQRQFDVVQNDAFQRITLSGNIPMSYSVKSGEFPEGISMTSAGAISGTPTEYGQFTVTVQGTTSEGPEQNPTIVIVLNVDEDEPVLSITVGTPEGPYKVGTSLSFPLTSNVSGTTWQVSGDAASWMSVSGSNVVGSVPSSSDEITEVSLTVSAQTPQGQTSSQTIEFTVEPVISFTTVPTADAVIIPVYEYNDDGTIVQSQALSLFDAVDAASSEFSFPDTLTVQGTFTGENADTVTWDWGDGSEIQTGNKFEHTYAEPGTYTITLTATNDVGSDVMELTITVGETGFGDLVFIGIIALLVLAVVYLLHRCGRHGRGRRD